MNRPPASKTSPELLLCLSMLYRPVPLHALQQVLGLPERVLQAELQALEKNGLLRRNGEKQRWLAANSGARQLMGRRGYRYGSGKDGADEERPLFLQGLERLWAKDLRGGSENIFRLLGQLLHSGHSAGALVCLDLLLGRLRGWRYAGRAREDNAHYLSTMQGVLGISLYMTRRLREIDEVLPTALKVAELLGDRRTSLQLRLMRTCHAFIVGGPSRENPQQALSRLGLDKPDLNKPDMDKLVEEIRELGDPDILAGTAYGIGMQHYARGEFRQAVEALRHDSLDLANLKSRYFSGLGLLTLTDSACSLGLFHTALGRMVRQLNQLSLVGAQFALKRIRIQAADVLLRAGFQDAALEMMSDAFSCCDDAAEPRLAVWGYRNLAFYHFQRGNLAAAHRILLRAVELSLKHGLQRSYLGLPTCFDMLQAFQAAGLPDMPGPYSLESTLQKALASPNPQWQGSALRIGAEQLLRKGGRPETAAAWLEDSLQRLRTVGNPMEAARSALALAKVKRMLGQTGEAESLHDLGCAALAEFRQFDCPPACRTAPVPPDGVDCLERCAKGFAALPAWVSLVAHVQSLTDCVLEAFQFERAALFVMEMGERGEKRKKPENGEKPDSRSGLAVQHFSEAELACRQFTAHRERMAACVENNRYQVHNSRNGAWLYLPLLLDAERACVLLAHCAFLTCNISGQSGASFETLRKLLEDELRLAFRLQQSIEARQREDGQKAREATLRLSRDGDIYYGPAMLEVLAWADKAAPTGAPVLILGETGVGKEELARRMHSDSGVSGPFVAVHPASIPEQLFESELFGHEKGAFTGAHKQKIGLLELADKGTLFIDEAGDIPPALQVKLLRVLQNKTFMRVGGIREIRSDFRLMSATSQDLEAKARDGSFREDLYYRIAVVPLLIPPLRERPEDIEQLAEMFRARFSTRYKRSLPALTVKDLGELRAHSWPGNIRELKSCMERAVILYDGKPIASFLSDPALHACQSCNGRTPGQNDGLAAERATEPARGQNGEQNEGQTGERSGEIAQNEPALFENLPTMKALQRLYIGHVLAHTRGKIDGSEGALEILGMKRSSLYTKIREYGLDKATLLYGPDKN